MVQKKDNLPVNTDPIVKDGGTITYANEVIAIISGIAASEIEGIAGMVTTGGLGEIISKNRNITRGVKVEVGTEEVSVDLYTIVEYGQPIQKVASEVQENVRKSIESMTGLKVVRVDIHVQGVSFEKDKKDTASRIEAAQIQHISDAAQEKKNKRAEKEAKELEAKAEQAAQDDKAAKEADIKQETAKPQTDKKAEPLETTDKPPVKVEPEKTAEKKTPVKPAAKKPATPRTRKKAPAPKDNKS
ncbi:MAG: Asp23/Gls24 family envelope stress response protein [Clostridiales bacterium]|nr:Asp23/Gls24 family envelope stress response protein [Clostridiales bacterium]